MCGRVVIELVFFASLHKAFSQCFLHCAPNILKIGFSPLLFRHPIITNPQPRPNEYIVLFAMIFCGVRKNNLEAYIVFVLVPCGFGGHALQRIYTRLIKTP